MKGAIKVLSGAIDKLIMSIFVLMTLLGLYALYDSYSLFLNAQDKGLLSYKPQPDSVSEEVPLEGYVAWLTLANTDIDFPIMQGIDNDEFLNKDPYGNYSLSGSIFLDYRNSADFTDEYSLIYGHHMEHGAMFGALDNYRERPYYRSHRDGMLMVGGKTYKLHIFAAAATFADEMVVFDPSDTDKESIMKFIKDNSLYYDEPDELDGDRILALSTCSSNGSIERFVVFAMVEP